MATIRTHRDLIAWQKGMDLAAAVYSWTEAIDRSEIFGLRSQMRRAAVSIPSNIAEGFGRQSTIDYLRFLRMARGSLAELDTHIRLSIRLAMLNESALLMELREEVDRILQGLIRSLETKVKSKPTL